jgi:hypothetical protein
VDVKQGTGRHPAARTGSSDVSRFFELLAAWFALAMTGGSLDAQQNRRLARRGGLQSRRHFAGVHWVNSAVAFSREQKSSPGTARPGERDGDLLARRRWMVDWQARRLPLGDHRNAAFSPYGTTTSIPGM